MGFWDFFKAKKIQEAEKLKKEELEIWLEARKKKVKEEEERIFKSIKERKTQLIFEFKEEIEALKRINVDERKAEDKIKLIVKENLGNYINYLEKLAEKLSQIESNSQIIEKINLSFSEFKTRSKISYEKATILIGKEIEKVNESSRRFLKEIEDILNENRETAENSQVISSLENKIKKINEANKTKSEIEKNLSDYGKIIADLNLKIKMRSSDIEKIKSSKEFIEEQAKKQEIERKKQELEKEIDSLRESINFKALANFYHSFEKEMGIVKEYRDNFKESIKKSREDLTNILNESKLINMQITEKLGKIEKIEEEIQETAIRDFGIKKLEEEIKKLSLEIEPISQKKSVETKRIEKLDLSIKESWDLIAADLKKINVELI